MDWAGKKPGKYCFVPLLDTATPLCEIEDVALAGEGVPVELSPGRAQIFEWL